MIMDGVIQQALDLLKKAAPDSTIILFGSHARGDAGPESDVDFLVVEPTLTARRREMVRLTDLLRPLRIRADIVVVSSKTYEEWRDTPGTVIFAAAQQGTVLYVAA